MSDDVTDPSAIYILLYLDPCNTQMTRPAGSVIWGLYQLNGIIIQRYPMNQTESDADC